MSIEIIETGEGEKGWLGGGEWALRRLINSFVLVYLKLEFIKMSLYKTNVYITKICKKTNRKLLLSFTALREKP